MAFYDGLGGFLKSGGWIDWPLAIAWLVLAVILAIVYCFVQPEIGKIGQDLTLKIIGGAIAFVGLLATWGIWYKLWVLSMIMPLLGHCVVIFFAGVAAVIFFVATIGFPSTRVKK